MEDKQQELWELLKMYMGLAEKQDEVIFRLSAIVKRQACELQHMREVYGFFEESPANTEEEQLAEESLKEYETMKTEGI